MKRYITLLRGVNVSGKNKISMSELKAHFIAYGYNDVLSYLNSGNIIFSCEEKEESKIASDISVLIYEKCKLDIKVLVILQSKLEKLLKKAPCWWGTDNKEWYDNLIFVIPPANIKEIVPKLGEPTQDLEQVSVDTMTIFWTFDRKKYSKSNWWKKTASTGIGEMITIRTANTLKKISVM